MTSNWMTELEEELAAAELEDMFAPEGFFRIHGVLANRRIGGPLRLRLSGRVSGANLDNALWRGRGVFLVNATRQQAREWAIRQAAQYGGEIEDRAGERSPGGRRHFHIWRPRTRAHRAIRSGHIFYGPLPSGEFLE
jgi:hypothetical protein